MQRAAPAVTLRTHGVGEVEFVSQGYGFEGWPRSGTRKGPQNLQGSTCKVAVHAGMVDRDRLRLIASALEAEPADIDVTIVRFRPVEIQAKCDGAPSLAIRPEQ